MIEARGNLWSVIATHRIITTNGTIKKSGECVMGRGNAYEASKMFPDLPLYLGKAIRDGGNVVRDLGRWPAPPNAGPRLIAFPVKHNWWEPADPILIEVSVHRLLDLITLLDPHGIGRWVMPRPGCGNGRLNWEDIKPLLKPLPDNVTVVTF